MKNATLRQLKTFVTVARRLSYSRAAEELHISQPAVSEQIRQLEGHVGMLLIAKRGRGIVLTPAGQAMLQHCIDITAHVASAEAAMAKLLHAQESTLRLGITSAGDYVFPRLLAAFIKRRTGVELEIAVQSRHELLRRLEADALDLIIIVSAPMDAGIEGVAFAPHPIVIVAHPAHPLAGKHSIPLSALENERFLVREAGTDTLASIKDRLFRRFATVPDTLEIESSEAIKQAVMAEIGISYLSARSVSAEVQAGTLAVLDVDGLPVIEQWQVAYRTDRPLPPVASAFRDFLVDEGAASIEALP